MQIINVDLIPGKVMPILHASQFDKGRVLGVKLYNGGAVYALAGTEVVSVSVRKPDGNIVTEALTNAGGSLVEIITTEQMTACAGCSLCEIKIENAGDVIGTANFVLDVEEDPTNGGIASQSEIDNLATQVAGLVATEVANQYDSANVIFDNDPTTGHGVGYAVTSEGVKNAIDAISPAASSVSYDNTGSGMTATNVQDAIDELDTNVGDLSTLTTPVYLATIATGTNITFISNTSYRVGNMVVLNCILKVEGNLANNATILSNIPKNGANAPIRFLRVVGADVYQGHDDNAGGFNIDANATSVSIFGALTASSSSPKYLFVNLTYICSLA